MTLITKSCRRCQQQKPLQEFGVQKTVKDGRRSTCKACMRVIDAGYRAGKLAARAAASKRWREENPEKSKASRIAWRKSNPERSSALYKAWVLANPVKIRAYGAARYSTPFGKLNASIRAGVVKHIKAGSKGGKRTEEVLGYSMVSLREHLEEHFLDGMTWDNYGSGWHVDHILPLASFSFETPDDAGFKLAWSLSNLQPLWAVDNMKKGARLDHPSQVTLLAANDNHVTPMEKAA